MTASPLVDTGSASLLDVDGSRSDLGIYGGSFGGQWNRDGDERSDYFWPGSWSQAPAGFSPADYDCNDRDPTVEGC